MDGNDYYEQEEEARLKLLFDIHNREVDEKRKKEASKGVDEKWH